jgi:hypothetical protein
MAFSPRSDGHAGFYSKFAGAAATQDFGLVLPTARENVCTGEIRYNDPIYYYVSTSASSIFAVGWEF